MSIPLGGPRSNSWLNSLPLILCGPILRKVHYESVSVWFAFKDDVTDIRLNVFAASNPSSPLLSGTVGRPLMLGKNLFVTLVTATSKGNQTRRGSDLWVRHFIQACGRRQTIEESRSFERRDRVHNLQAVCVSHLLPSG